MHKWLQFFPIVMVLVVSLGIFFEGSKETSFAYTVRQVMLYYFSDPSEDGKLKFVSSDEDVFVVGSAESILKPLEVLDMYEEDGFTCIRTYEKSPVLCPASCTVSIEEGVMTLRSGYLVAKLYGIEVFGVSHGDKVKKGRVLGTLAGDTLRCKVFFKDKPVPYEKLRDYL